MRSPTPLEAILLDELRNVLMTLQERILGKKNFMEFMGRIRNTILLAEKELRQ